jgi:hypothetical protein
VYKLIRYKIEKAKLNSLAWQSKHKITYLTSGYMCTLIHDIWIHVYTDTWHLVTCVHWYMTSGYMCTLIHDIWLHVYTDTWHLDTCVHWYMTSGYMCTLIHDIWLHVYTDTWHLVTCVHWYMTSGYMCTLIQRQHLLNNECCFLCYLYYPPQVTYLLYTDNLTFTYKIFSFQVSYNCVFELMRSITGWVTCDYVPHT